MTTTHETDVAIVGAGPVGLTLAMVLSRHGVRTTLIETRARGEPPNVKCNHVASRSMEIFRTLGIVERVRDAGLPPDYPNDIAYRTAFTGPELTRIPIPCRRDRYTAVGGPDTWWPTPEPPHRINQIYLEPILFESAWAMAGVQILNRTRFDGFDEDGEAVTARAMALDGGEHVEVRARYLVGCDGGRSAVRRGIGASLQGDAVVQRVQSTYIRAPALLGLQAGPPAWVNFSLNPRRSGSVYAIDGRETWLIHNYLRDGEADFDSVDRDRSIRDILGAEPEFDYEILSREDWFGRRLVADKLRRGRVFICGDAAHLWVPYAGYGMNAGIADAEDLGWLIAARVAGWGGPAMLDAYERERLPITEQVSHFAMNHAHAMAKARGAVPDVIEDESPAGEAARREVGRRAYELNVQQYCCGGLNFGYYYDRSPIIAYDGEQAPTYGMAEFTPSTVPGCRLPHAWLDDGGSLYDALGPDYALLRFDPAVEVGALVEAAARRFVPLTVLDVGSEDARRLYCEKLVIARPDRHVAWRGDCLPVDELALVDRLRGAG